MLKDLWLDKLNSVKGFKKPNCQGDLMIIVTSETLIQTNIGILENLKDSDARSVISKVSRSLLRIRLLEDEVKKSSRDSSRDQTWT